jgi:PIN domain nuclease of toxin-antitoxin system
VNLLLDTHTLLWAYWADPKLSAAAAALITDPANRCFVSPASYWEIAIKIAISKLTLSESFPDFMQHAILDNGFAFLPIEPRHAAALIGLPQLPTHKDPFDRMFISQAIVEGMPIVSADSALDAYPITRLW